MIKSGKLWVGVRDYGFSSLCWDLYLRGQATVIRAACPSGRFLESNSPLYPKQDDPMTIGQSWDKQVPFPTYVHISKRTETKPCVPFRTSIPRSQMGIGATGHTWAGRKRAPRHQDPSQPGPEAGQGMEPQLGLCSCPLVNLAEPLILRASGCFSVQRGFGLGDLMSGLMLCRVLCGPPGLPPSPGLLPVVM